MNTHTPRSSDKTKAIYIPAHRQLVVFLAAAASFALIFGHGGPSAKTGSYLTIKHNFAIY